MTPTPPGLLGQVGRDEVDGVPVLWAGAPGPLVASLVFRVGTADEEIAERGFTHLLEHAVLEQFAGRDFEFNGTTELLHTSLHFRGTPDEVVEALAAATTWLRTSAGSAVADIHHDVLAAEEHERRSGLGRQVLALLFGHAAFGRAALPEYGLRTATIERVESWAATYFHGGNARLVLSGPPPGALRLDLPSGPAIRDVPQAVPQQDLPGWLEQEQDGCTLAMVTDRGAVASITDEVLREAAGERLRHESGSTYSVGGDRVALGLDGPASALSLLGFGLRPERHDEGTRAFVELLGELAEDVPDDLVARLRRRRRRIEDEPNAAVSLAFATAREELLGDDGQLATFMEEQFTITPDDVVSELRRRHDAMLLLAPRPAVPLEGAEWYPVSLWSTERLTGQSYLPTPGTESGLELRVSNAGATLVANDDDDVITVRFDECVALLRWDDGTRVLIGRDGFQLPLRAEGWPDLGNLGPWLDDRVLDRVIDMGERETPDVDADDRSSGVVGPEHPLWLQVVARLLAPFGVAVLLLGSMLVGDADLGPGEVGPAVAILLVIAGVVGVCWSGLWWLREGRRDQRRRPATTEGGDRSSGPR